MSRVILDDMVASKLMPSLFQQAHHQLAAGVGLRCAGIAARDDYAGYAVRRMGLVFLMCVAGPMRLMLQHIIPTRNLV